MMSRPRIAILISGRGSNMMALLDAIEDGRLDADAFVISNVPTAPGVELARSRGVDTLVLPSKGIPREVHDRRMIEAIEERNAVLICLAGYMRLLGTPFIERFRGKILNIHPALLPAFPGLEVQRKALDHGVKISGCTVHFVDEGLDSGPIVMQAAVPVYDSDTEETLAERILREEHRIYPKAVAFVLQGSLRFEGRRVLGSAPEPDSKN